MRRCVDDGREQIANKVRWRMFVTCSMCGSGGGGGRASERAIHAHQTLLLYSHHSLSSRQPNQTKPNQRRGRGRGRAVHARDCGAVTTASIPRPLAAKVACTIVVRPLAGHAPSCLSAKVLALLFRSPSLLGTRKRSARETPAAARTSGVAAGAGGAMPYTPGATTGAYAP